MSTSVKLSLRFMVLLTVAVLSLSVLFSAMLRYFVRLQQDADVENAALKIEQELNAGARSLAIPYFITYTVYDVQEKSVLYTNDPFLPLLRDTDGRAVRYIAKNYFTDGDLNILYYARPYSAKGRKLIIETALNMDTDSSSLAQRGIPRTLALAIIPVLVISFLVSLFITRNTMKPVVRMTREARRISSENLDRQLSVKHKPPHMDENDLLAATFNELFVRLKVDFDRERSFTSDVSHELKTPVAVILGQANLLRRWGKNDATQTEKSLGIIIKEARSMESIITNLLQLSRLESGKRTAVMENVRLSELFARLKEEMDSFAPTAELTVEGDTDYTLRTDRELLHQVCTIVVTNGIKFALAAGKEAHVTIRTEDGGTRIFILDNGPGFRDDVLPHIFERFYRGDSSHNRAAGGSGLGLSIAESIMRVLGGSIVARNRSDSDGTATTGAEIELRLPSGTTARASG